jgi:hypothetical protein
MLQMKQGSFSTGAGTSDVNVELGFKPLFIMIQNDGTGASNADRHLWFATMGDDTCFTQVAAGGTSVDAADAISVYTTNNYGFTVAAELCGAADVFHYVAFGVGYYEAHGDLDPA